jgi:hypothetical protein
MSVIKTAKAADNVFNIMYREVTKIMHCLCWALVRITKNIHKILDFTKCRNTKLGVPVVRDSDLYGQK